jgi:hypothetical protein
MKVYTKMPAALKPYYQNELAKAAASLKKEHFIISWRHLERAHILAQPYPFQHTVGNTGGANVPPLQPMEIPEDLATIINNTKAK